MDLQAFTFMHSLCNIHANMQLMKTFRYNSKVLSEYETGDPSQITRYFKVTNTESI